MATALTPRSLFPAYALPGLFQGRGKKWENLVWRVQDLPETHPEHLAYTLALTRLAREQGMDTGALCPEPACALCAAEIVEATGLAGRDLYDIFRATLDEVEAFMAQSETEAERVAA